MEKASLTEMGSHNEDPTFHYAEIECKANSTTSKLENETLKKKSGTIAERKIAVATQRNTIFTQIAPS